MSAGGHQVENPAGRADQPDRADGVGLPRALGVRKPLDPFPLVERIVTREHGDGDVVGRVEGRAGADEGAGQAPGRVRAPHQGDPVVPAQVDGHRQGRLRPMGVEQSPYGRDGGGVGVVRGQVGRCRELDGERLGGDAVPDVQEGRVVRLALPHPRAVGRDRRQRGRCGMQPEEGLALARRSSAYGVPHACQVPQVAPPRAGQLAPALTALPVELEAEVGDRRHQEQAGRDDPHLRAAAAERRDQHHGSQAAEHRDRAHRHSAGALGGGQPRRLVEPDPARRQLRRCRHAGESTAAGRRTEPASPLAVDNSGHRFPAVVGSGTCGFVGTARCRLTTSKGAPPWRSPMSSARETAP